MNIDDNFIKSFFKICVKIYDYDDENKDIEIKNLNDFIDKCTDKIAVIESNDLLNVQLAESSTEITKLSKKIKEYESKYSKLYLELNDCKRKINNKILENDELIDKNDKLYQTKIKYENDIILLQKSNEKYKERYNTAKIKNELMFKKLRDTQEFLKEMTDEYQYLEYEKMELAEKNNKFLEENEKYMKEINKIEDLKKIMSNKLSSDTLEHLDISIIEAIDRANEYEKKYNESQTQIKILTNNFESVNEKYNNLLLTQANGTNELKEHIKLLMQQIEEERKKYNENMILIETKHNIEKEQQNIKNQTIQTGGNGNGNCNGDGVKMFDIRDKKAHDFFNKDILLFNEKNNGVKKQDENQYKNKNISYSTDYMVDYLKMSDKIVSSDKKTHLNSKYHNDLNTINELSEEPNEIIGKKNIFIKHKITESTDEYIDLGKVNIFNTNEEINENDGEKLQNELKQFINENGKQEKIIINNVQNNNDVVFVGGGKKNSIEIRKIDDKYKMKFENGFSTITEQNIDLKDDAKIKKIRHKKYMRHNREKSKLADLQYELTKN